MPLTFTIPIPLTDLRSLSHLYKLLLASTMRRCGRSFQSANTSGRTGGSLYRTKERSERNSMPLVVVVVHDRRPRRKAMRRKKHRRVDRDDEKKRGRRQQLSFCLSPRRSPARMKDSNFRAASSQELTSRPVTQHALGDGEDRE